MRSGDLGGVAVRTIRDHDRDTNLAAGVGCGCFLVALGLIAGVAVTMGVLALQVTP